MESRATMFCVLNSLDINRGGMTKAALLQANLFANSGYETFIITFNFDPRYNTIIQQLIKEGKIDKRIKLLNMFESLSHTNRSSLKHKENETLQRIEECKAVLDKRAGHNAYRAYENGLYTTYINYDKGNKLSFLDYFNEQRYRTKREEYDEFGYLRKVAYMDFELNKARQIIYYDDNGQAYLSVWYNPKNGNANRLNHFDSNGALQSVHTKEVDLKTEWLESIIQDYDYPVLVCDARTSDPVMMNVKLDKAIKIWRLHSNHVKPPYDVNGEIGGKIAPTLEAIDELDVALLLTESQKAHFEQRFGNKDNIRVIPHYMKNFADTGWFSSFKRKENLAVIISRFSSLKRIDHAIKAFKKVSDRVPEAKLEIWGLGDEEPNLKKLVKELDLQNHVFLKGYTNDPDKLYQKALFSVLTSKSEGFSLGILESMSNGAPMISYDINYGPRDLIIDGKTGFIIENDNIEQLAEKMIWMFENKNSATKMGEAAVRDMKERFNEQQYRDKWVDTIETAVKNKKAKLGVSSR
ncbi:glycosyltransferase [Peribacillus muralis]|uniref:glycosyltransferase n=1 Tax=Peribacillus muralis TaxID=264697 RepID=UPI0037F8C9A3